MLLAVKEYGSHYIAAAIQVVSHVHWVEVCWTFAQRARTI